MGRVLLGFFPGQKATKVNLFMFMVGAFAGGGMLFVLVFLYVAVANVHLTPHAENGLTFFSWLIGGFIGGTAVAWLMIRLTAPRKDDGTTGR